MDTAFSDQNPLVNQGTCMRLPVSAQQTDKLIYFYWIHGKKSETARHLKLLWKTNRINPLDVVYTYYR
jgi:hypothetical protein